jgi:hypothetical protein
MGGADGPLAAFTWVQIPSAPPNFAGPARRRRGHNVATVSCAASIGTPPAVFEGITATKDYVDYWNHVNPVEGEEGSSPRLLSCNRGSWGER